jgi:hypothetical protein
MAEALALALTADDDYYTAEKLQQIWHPQWFDTFMVRGEWCSGEGILDPVPAMWQSYHPYACHACKRSPCLVPDQNRGRPGVLSNLMTCSSCQVVKYCSKAHQKADWKDHKTCKSSAT